jgi:hypothetical protein
MAIVPYVSGVELATEVDVMERPPTASVWKGVLTFPPQKLVWARVQSTNPSQPTKFCCACMTLTSTGTDPVFFSENWNTATGIHEAFESNGMAGVMASRDMCTGNPGMS